MEIKDIKYTKGKTDEELEYLIFEDKKSYSVSFLLKIKTGAIYDKKPGLSHFLEHVVLKSSKNVTHKQRLKELEYRGASRNGITSYEYNEYYITLPFTELNYGFSYLEDLLIHAKLKKQEVETERKVIFDEILKNNNDPYSLSYELTKRNYLKKQSPFYNSILGSQKTLLDISRKDLADFYAQFNSKNIILGVSGRIEEEEIIKKIKKLSRKLNESKKKEKYGFQDIITKNPEKILIHPSTLSKNSIVSLTILDKGYNELNIKESISRGLLSNILTRGSSSYLYEALRTDTGYLYSYWIPNYIYNAFSMQGMIFECDPKNVCKILKLINETINKVKRKKISSNEVNHWKRYTKNRILIRNDNHINIMNELVDDLFNLGKMYTPIDLLEIQKKVTTEDVNRQLEKLDLNKYTVMTFGNTRGINERKIKKSLE